MAAPGTPIRVLMATPRFYPEMGGVETHVYQVARRMAAAGAEVTVLTTDRSGTLPPLEQTQGYTVRRVRAWPEQRDYHLAPDIYREIRRGRWDLVHCQSYHTAVPPLAMLAALRSRIPYVVTFHGGGHTSELRNRVRGLQLAVLRPLLARAAQLVAVARFEIALYGSQLRLPASRFTLIPNGVDLGTAEAQPAQQTDAPLLLAVGRLERYKGHQRALTALPHVLRTHPGARLRIVGAGPYESELRRLADEHGVAAQVEIGAIPPEDRDGMARALSQASVVTLLSDFETHPIAALEALAMRRPVVVTHTSGLGELADQGLARAVPLSSSPAEIAAAIVEQIQRPLTPATLDLPTWDQCAHKLLHLYQDILARN